MRCNKRTIHNYMSSIQKAKFFFETIEKSNLLTYFTTDFTNLSLKLKLVIESDAKELVRSLFIESVVETVMTVITLSGHRLEVQFCALDILYHLVPCSAKPGEFTKYSPQVFA